MPFDIEGSTEELRKKAMKGDVLLKLIVMDHLMSKFPNISAGHLHNMCQSYITNDYLAARYNTITHWRTHFRTPVHDEWADLHAGGAVLPPATGHRVLDATRFEAWIAARFEHNSECLIMTASEVLPVLGLED
jgi:dsRNA-specific ribonuclease